MNKRYTCIDQLRGIAVLLMIIFHLFYDLNEHGIFAINLKSTFWYGLPRFIVAIFMLTVGISLSLAHSQKINFKKFFKRLIILIICSFIISLSTYIIFPSQWIFFGTLHSIAFCSAAALPMVKFPKISVLIFILILFGIFIGLSLPWIYLHPSMDYIPPYPWIGFVLFGIFLGDIKIYKFFNYSHPILSFLELLGRNSLVIYLTHQPILYGGTWIIKVISSP